VQTAALRPAEGPVGQGRDRALQRDDTSENFIGIKPPAVWFVDDLIQQS